MKNLNYFFKQKHYFCPIPSLQKLFRMKKVLIPILLIAIYLNPLLAQIKQGSWMIGGGMGSNRQPSFFRAWTNPKLGYFITDRLLMGAAIHFEWTEPAPNLVFSVRSINTQLLPFARFYFTPMHRFKFFNEVEAEWLSDYAKTLTAPSRFINTWSKHSKFWLRNRFGLNYFLSDNIAVEVQLPYTIYHKEDSISFWQPQKEYSFPKFTFSPTFRMRLFLNTAKQSGDVLAEKYLKKGNRTYGIQGNISLGANSLSILAPNIGYFITDKCMIGSKLWIFIPDKGDIGATIGPEIRFYQPMNLN